MAVININYDEGNEMDLGYESVEISYDNLKSKKVFNSGNFVKDWFDCIKFCILELPDGNHPIVHSSSVDHFFMDGAKYDSAYLITNDASKKVYLSYPAKDEDTDGIELFVPDGTKPTWEELK